MLLIVILHKNVPGIKEILNSTLHCLLIKKTMIIDVAEKLWIQFPQINNQQSRFLTYIWTEFYVWVSLLSSFC